MESSLWEELCVPCLRSIVGLGDDMPDTESRIFWSELGPDAQEEACAHIEREGLAQHEAEERKTLNSPRSRVSVACWSWKEGC